MYPSRTLTPEQIRAKQDREEIRNARTIRFSRNALEHYKTSAEIDNKIIAASKAAKPAV
jgi:hypothetical protein